MKLYYHIKELCQTHNIIRKVTIYDWYCLIGTNDRDIFVPPLNRPLHYFINMHEIGHVYDFLENSGGDLACHRLKGIPAIERSAWDWALENSILPVTKYWMDHAQEMTDYYKGRNATGSDNR